MTSICVAVIDTGVNPNQGDVIPGLNLTDEPDGYGTHGTEIAQTILSIAPHAQIVPIKIVNAQGILRNPDAMEHAFQWILENYDRLNIRVVCAAIADSSCSDSDEYYAEHPLRSLIVQLREVGVVTVAAAGNWYSNYQRQGMAFPAILREVVSVGAIEKTSAGFQLTQNSQRLHPSAQTDCYTTFLVEPGAPGDTSGATAIVAGHFANLARSRMTIEESIEWLNRSCQMVLDDDRLMWKMLASFASLSSDCAPGGEHPQQ
jgi:subtilisin family serine protease